MSSEHLLHTYSANWKSFVIPRSINFSIVAYIILVYPHVSHVSHLRLTVNGLQKAEVTLKVTLTVAREDFSTIKKTPIVFPKTLIVFSLCEGSHIF